MPEANVSATAWDGKKNIVICCDGTGNKFFSDLDAGGSNSNVVKLYTTLIIDNKQVGYYHPGVGTANDPAAKHWIARKWSMIKGLAFAAGFKDNVLDAYRYLMESYDDGDHVYIFGFSRGSYTARALAGLLDSHGLLCKGNEGHLPYAWTEYADHHDERHDKRVKPNKRFKETFAHKGFRVHFMGIWDTVSSVGWINTPLRLFNVARNPTVEIGRHAISIDECRCFYRDNLWQSAKPEELKEVASTEEPDPKQDLLEVWFAGVHSDIGGSYSQKTSGLSNIVLEWMLEEAIKAGLCTKPEMVDLVLGRDPWVSSHPDPLCVHSGARAPIPGTDHPKVLDLETKRKIDDLRPLYEKPTTTEVHQSLRGAWWVLELFPHRYYDKDDAAENWRTPLGMPRRIPKEALIHKTVRERIEQKTGGYQPKNVVGGLESLHPVEIEGQDPGALFRYSPKDDPKPKRNEAFERIGVMVLVTALDLVVVTAVLAVVPVTIWWFRSHTQ